MYNVWGNIPFYGMWEAYMQFHIYAVSYAWRYRICNKLTMTVHWGIHL